MTRSRSRRLFAVRWSSAVFIVSMSLGSGQREAGWIVFPGIEDHGPAVARILHVARHEEEIMFDRGRGEESVDDWRSLPGPALDVARDHAPRSAARRVGTECVSTLRSRWCADHYNKKNNT